MPVALSVAFTCAFGTEPPDGSVTVPLIAPRNVCAFAAAPKLRIITTARNNRLITSTPLNRFSEQLSSLQPASPCRVAARLTSANHTPLLKNKNHSPERNTTRHLGEPRPCSRQSKKEKLPEAKMARFRGCYSKAARPVKADIVIPAI